MKLAIISDIHGNFEALSTVLNYCDKNSLDKIICLGDVVGYGPNPNECVHIIEQNAEVKLMGNHDHAVIGLTDTNRFNISAQRAVDWTLMQLDEKALEYISLYKMSYEIDNLFFVHASPSNPLLWNYIMDIYDAQYEMSFLKENQVCFIGHSHFPAIFSYDTKLTENEVNLSDNDRMIINVGSVGQPRDGIPKASFGILDTDENIYKNIRVEYPYQDTIGKIKETTLPIYLGIRLAMGK